MTAIAIDVKRVLVDPALQPRVDGLDAAHVRELQENPQGWPPLVIVERGGYYVPVDGLHRFAAAQNLGLKTILAEVRELPADGDLQGLAFVLNAAHGRPLTRADKRREAERLLAAHPAISNQAVADRVLLSPSTVAEYRGRLVAAGQMPVTEQRVSRSGVSYTPPSSRQPGELPPEQETLAERLLTASERREQLRLVRYLERLSVALDDQYAFTSWVDAGDAAKSCRAVLGDEKAAELGADLGPMVRNLLDVASALGYEDEA